MGAIKQNAVCAVNVQTAKSKFMEVKNVRFISAR